MKIYMVSLLHRATINNAVVKVLFAHDAHFIIIIRAVERLIFLIALLTALIFSA